jgi:hypothetical protein
MIANMPIQEEVNEQNKHQKAEVRLTMMLQMPRLWFLSAFWLSMTIQEAYSFIAVPSLAKCSHGRSLSAKTDKADNEFFNDFQSAADKIQVEKTRQQLEDSNIQSFLKRKPVKLRYDVARRWVQANLGPDTQEEFEDLVANGNLRTPYIPKRPEEWYTRTREWISWDHFLKGIYDNSNPSSVGPATGVFD